MFFDYLFVVLWYELNNNHSVVRQHVEEIMIEMACRWEHVIFEEP